MNIFDTLQLRAKSRNLDDDCDVYDKAEAVIDAICREVRQLAAEGLVSTSLEADEVVHYAAMWLLTRDQDTGVGQIWDLPDSLGEGGKS